MAGAGSAQGGSGGAGGGGPCTHCKKYANNGGMLCEKSKPLFDALVACLCQPGICGGAGGDCQAECSDPTPPTTMEPCVTCYELAVQSDCATEWTACLADTQDAG